VQRIVAADAALLVAADSDGDTPLHNAARGGHTHVVQLLLQHGASAMTLNHADQTPRDAAGSDADPELAQTLLAAEQRCPAPC
jgi:ankyrin repeat protein